MTKKFWVHIYLSIFCTCAGIGFLIVSYEFLWVSAYDDYLVLGFLICLIFGCITIFGVVASWVNKIPWMPLLYDWASIVLVCILLVTFIIRSQTDGFNFETATVVTMYVIGLYLNWQAMRKLHHVVT